MFHGTGECMTKEPTPLAPFTLVGIGRSPSRKHHHVGAERFNRAVIYSNQNLLVNMPAGSTKLLSSISKSSADINKTDIRKEFHVGVVSSVGTAMFPSDQ